MKARLTGARAARGDVLIFLDAHCETSADWLRPLLQRITHKRDSVLTPLIDVVDQTSFKLEAAEYFQVGGFTFNGHFTWIDVPEKEKKRRGSDIAPTWSPTMAGGLFAINRAYFWELGAYDEQMAGWGGENLEMSFRVWQCGGTLETVPCSRVGHVFRSFHPYGLPAQSDTHGINTARMAEVWMDEYAELFYLHRPDLRNNPKIGDVTHRKILREKLKCKSFQWYLDNIYEDKFVPVRDVYGFGRFRNPGSGFCLDTMQRDGEASPLGVYPCHSTLQATQYLALSLAGEMRDEEKCAQLQFTRKEKNAVDDSPRKVFMTTCHGKHRGQKWKYVPSTSQLQHVESGLCLDAGFEPGADVTVATCNDRVQQRWLIDYAEYNNFNGPNGEMSERAEKLRKLRGQRRKSRSLLSYDEKARRHAHKRKNQKKKKKRRDGKNKKKDKFILKLLRTRSNGTEEHLEVDIYCKHRKLYPNNTFVRDVVTLLNDKDVKVINNGRLFERNKVTDLKDVEIKKMKVKDKMADYDDYTKKPRHKKLRTTPSMERKLKHVPAVNMATPAPLAARNDNKKIIIEEFVAVKPDRIKKQKKRKRKHSRQSTLPPTTEREGSEVIPGVKKRVKSGEELDTPMLSAEDSPMLLGNDKAVDRKVNVMVRDDAENWPVGESRFRRNNSDHLTQPIRRQENTELNDGGDDESIDALPDRDGDKEPVKVVLRSNLTFNIGDEFFAWRPKNDKNEVTKDLNPQQIELIIKPNAAFVETNKIDVESGKTDRKPSVKTDKLSDTDRKFDSFKHVSNDIDSEGSLEEGDYRRDRADGALDDKSEGSSSSSESCDD